MHGPSVSPAAHAALRSAAQVRGAIEVEDRAVPGHWEGDLIIGTDRSAIGTIVERATRFTMLIHLPRMPGYGTEPRVKNGPALAGYGAVTMKNALASKMTTLPAQLRRSLTWDRGKELSGHAQFALDTLQEVMKLQNISFLFSVLKRHYSDCFKS